ncbi:hypothetical protein K1719_024671 [Acacia pycnantha]|nr:hypothetical protein K1719_024671 [Acacia pycnantha]
MIGRADIEGSKSNVAMNAWLPQAGYPCDDEAFGYLKRVIVTPAVYPRLVEFLHFDIRAGRNHIASASAGPSQCFVLIKRSDSPCQYRLSRLFGAGKGPRRAVPSPSPAGTRQPALAAGAARAIRRRPDGFGAGTPCPALEPILFPRLRIHFADFPCLHCSIDRRLFTLETDAVMSTAGRGRHTVLRIFKGRRAHRTPRDVRCSSGRWTLPPAEPFPRVGGC